MRTWPSALHVDHVDICAVSSEQAQGWAAALVRASTPFSVRPYPDDVYWFTVKREIEPRLDEILSVQS